MKVPLIVRLSGAHVSEGRKIIADSGLLIVLADTLAQAAKKAITARNRVVAESPGER